MPLVMNVFEPFSTQPSPSLRAVVWMPCRSLPAPGSVIAMAVISSPLAEARQPALLLLVGGEVAQVRADDVVVQAEADAAGADPGHLLVEDGVVAEVADPAAAVLLVDVHAEQPLLRRRRARRRAARCRPSPTGRGRGRRSSPPRPGPSRGSRRARPRTGSGACHAVCPTAVGSAVSPVGAEPVDDELARGRRRRQRAVRRREGVDAEHELHRVAGDCSTTVTSSSSTKNATWPGSTRPRSVEVRRRRRRPAACAHSSVMPAGRRTGARPCPTGRRRRAARRGRRSRRRRSPPSGPARPRTRSSRARPCCSGRRDPRPELEEPYCGGRTRTSSCVLPDDPPSGGSGAAARRSRAPGRTPVCTRRHGVPPSTRGTTAAGRPPAAAGRGRREPGSAGSDCGFSGKRPT